METREILAVRGKLLQAWKLGWEPSAAHSIFLSGLDCCRRDLLSISHEAGGIPGTVDSSRQSIRRACMPWDVGYCCGAGD